MDEKKSTGDLLDILEKKPLKASLDEIRPEQLTESLSEYLTWLIAERSLKPADILERSGMKKPYFYELINGTKTNPSRDKLIQLCFGLEFSLDETQTFLKRFGTAQLYPRNRRDSILIYCFHHKMTIIETDIRLMEFGENTFLNIE